jgi:hypothetical protein
MVLTGIQRAILTARVGAMRVGAFRVGFVPKDTKGVAPGSIGPFYIWTRQYRSDTTWTAVKR